MARKTNSIREAGQINGVPPVDSDPGAIRQPRWGGGAVEVEQKGLVQQEWGYWVPGRFLREGLGPHDFVEEARGRPGCKADPEGLTEGPTAAQITGPGPSAPSPSRAERAWSRMLREA